MARSTKNAARCGYDVVRRRSCVTNCDTSAWKLASHPVAIPPEGRGTATPNEVNQLSSGCKGQKDDCPEHPLGESSTDGKGHRSFAAQTDAGQHQRQQCGRRGQQQQDRNHVVEQLRSCHPSNPHARDLPSSELTVVRSAARSICLPYGLPAQLRLVMRHAVKSHPLFRS